MEIHSLGVVEVISGVRRVGYQSLGVRHFLSLGIPD